MGTFVGVATVMLFLLSLYHGDDEDDAITVEWDPRSSDFGKVRSGNTRYDILGGFGQYIRFAAQFGPTAVTLGYLPAERKSTRTGKISEITKNKFPFKSPMMLPLDFGRSKLAPLPATAWNLIEGQDMIGGEYSFDDILPGFMPLALQDTYDAIQEQGPRALMSTFIPATFGIGVQTYESGKKKSSEASKEDK